ncbi:MAG: DUF1351 domain-containing protein [Lachnospiraceae bacterium]|nr:DUF1351 domain-containing protein [Lachnospiraceae bacterium]
MQEINLVVEQQQGVINTNFDEIRARLSEGLEEYKNMVFTEESKKDAKETLASLRKLKTAVDGERKRIKKEYMAPCDAFESQVKELTKLIDEPITFIDGQVKAFEQKRLEEKRELIKAIYEGIMDCHKEAAEYVPLDRIYDSKWENATTSQKAITEDIIARVQAVEKDLTTILGMESKFEDKGLESYKATLELSDAIETMNRYQKKEEEILRRQEEEAKRKTEMEAERMEESSQEIPKTVPVKEPENMEEFVEPEETLFNATYEVKADAFQIVKLESAMREYGIEFRRVQ